MVRKIRISLAVGGLVILAAVISTIVFVQDIDPSYQGKRLSAWAREIVPWQGPDTPQVITLRNYGSNATPLIVMMLNARDSDLKKKALELLHKQHVIKIAAEYQPAALTQLGGLKAAIVLGADVPGAIPPMVRLINDFPARVRDRSVAECALYVLAAMGPQSIPGLLQSLSNQDLSIRIKAAQLLGPHPDAGTPETFAALGRLTNDANPTLRAAASQSLALVQLRKDQRLPPSALKWHDDPDLPGDTPSVWDMKRGTRVLRTSPLFPGFNGEDMFGTHLSNGGRNETGTTIFQDNMPDGTVNWIEWETPGPVTIRSFGFLAFHQPADQFFQRGIRTLRLFSKADSDQNYSLIYSEELSVPYGQGYFSCLLFLFRNLDSPVTARQFRAEFVQNGAGPYFGSRIVALYGFTNNLNLPTALSALQNQVKSTQDDGRRFLTNQAQIHK